MAMCNPALTFAVIPLFLLTVLIMSVRSAHADDAYEYTGAGDFDFSEQDPKEVVTIPGTNMKAGMFKYDFDKDYKDGVGTFKAGILVEGDAFYYPDDTGEVGAMDPGGDCNFGVYKDIFLMDCYPYGASHNRMMFVFRFRKKIEFLEFSGGPGTDFMTVTVEEKIQGFDRSDYKLPVWMDIRDYDNDGKPEVPLEVLLESYIPPDRPIDTCIIYLELRDDGLLVDLNPALYKPLFEEEKKKNSSIEKSGAYYVYGFFYGALTLDEIRVDPVLRSDKKRYKRIIKFLEKKPMWDAYYKKHEAWEKLPIKKYYLKRR